MSFSVFLCKALNRLFPLPRHPFNLHNQDKLTYAEWQYDMGRRTVEFFLKRRMRGRCLGAKECWILAAEPAEDAVLCIPGAAIVYGIETVEYYKEEAEQLARQKCLRTGSGL